MSVQNLLQKRKTFRLTMNKLNGNQQKINTPTTASIILIICKEKEKCGNINFVIIENEIYWQLIEWQKNLPLVTVSEFERIVI